MSQDVLCILESLGHLCIVRLEREVEWESLSVALLVHVGHQSALRIKQDLRVVLEIHLYYFVAQTEHYCMLRSHPFLHIHLSDLLGRSYLFGRVGVLGLVWVVFKVGSEVLEQSNFLL